MKNEGCQASLDSSYFSRLDTGKRVDSCFTRPSKDPLAPSPAWRRVNEPWVTPRTIGAVSFIGPFIVAGQRPLLDGTTEWGRDFRFMLPLYYFYFAWLSPNSLACSCILLRPFPLLSPVFLLFLSYTFFVSQAVRSQHSSFPFF